MWDTNTGSMGQLSYGIIPLIMWCSITFQEGKGSSGFLWCHPLWF